MYQRRPKYRIHTNIEHPERALLRPIERTPLIGAAAYEPKKLRPLSCNLRHKAAVMKANPRPLSSMAKGARKYLRSIESQCTKQDEQSFIVNNRYQRPESNYSRHYQKKLNNDRCRSAEYKRPAHSSYLELKKRFETREKELHSSAIYN
jgi:hypothetical protein